MIVPVILTLLGCGDDAPSDAGDLPVDSSAPTVQVERLSPEDRLLRISMALRGVRPSLAEYDELAADPASLEVLVDRWLEDPAFGETVKDMYAEALLIRADTEPILLSQGPLEDVTSDRIFDAMSESSLKLIERTVMEDRPFTEILTSPSVMANDVLALAYDLDYDPSGPEWQVSSWRDDRPVAGILSDNGLWMRYPSNGSNYHRGRAAFVAKTFLCDDFNNRDVVVDGGIDLSDGDAVAQAVTSLPNCIGCHQALEPLSAFFWGFRQDTLRTAQFRAYNRFDCEGESKDYCWPLAFWKTEFEDDWIANGLMAPGYYGVPGQRFSDLGEFVANDPRFAQCTARRFYGYLTQTNLLEADLNVIAPLHDELVATGFDAKSLARAIVLDDDFAIARDPSGEGGPWAPMQLIRPEQFARTVDDLTGFRMRVAPGCSFDGCFMDLDMGVSDRYGFRAMSGGVDGLQVTSPTHTPTPTKVMFMRYLASEAAGYVVDDLVAGGADGRALFPVVADDPSTTDDALVREQIAHLHARILGEFLADDDPEVLATQALFELSLADGQPASHGWKQVVTALLQDTRMLFY